MPAGTQANATFLAKAAGIVAGLAVVDLVSAAATECFFNQISTCLDFEFKA